MNTLKPLEKLDIVLSIYNQEKLIERVLGGIFNSTTTPFNLIVVFDGCTDNTKEVALNFISNTKPSLLRDLRIAEAPNVYETRANNIGFKLGTENYLITIQDDVVIEEKGWERRLTFPIRAYDDIFAVSGRTALTILVNEHGFVTFEDKAAREFMTLPRSRFALRSTINRGPVAFRTDILKKLNYLDEAFAPAQLDEADLVIRAYELFNLKSGALQIQWRSDLAWGKTRASESSMNTNATLRKNALILQAKHPRVTSGTEKIIEERIIRDNKIDYITRDPLVLRQVKQLRGLKRTLVFLGSRKYHALKVRLARATKVSTPAAE